MTVKKAINLKVVPLWSKTGKPREKITKINTDTEVCPFFFSLFLNRIRAMWRHQKRSLSKNAQTFIRLQKEPIRP